MPRKKKTEQVEEQNVIEFPTEIDIPEPEKMTFTEFINNISDATVDEIVEYMNENGLVHKYIPFRDLARAAADIVSEVSYDDDGVFTKNTVAMQLRTTVTWIMLHLDVEYEEITYFELYDAIKEYEIGEAVNKIIGGYTAEIDFEVMVNDMWDDIQFNEYSVEASMRKIANAVNTIIDTLNNGVSDAVNSPEIVKTIIGEITSNVEK